MSLSDLDCKRAQPKEKSYRLFDSGGLYLEVKPTGKSIWRFKYRFYGKERLLTIGKYPKVSLIKAREDRDKAKDSIENGVDPAQKKQDQKKLKKFHEAQTFELIALEWCEKNQVIWSEKYAKHMKSRLEHNVFPEIGNRAMTTLTVQHILACVQKVEQRNAHDLAHRILQSIGQVMRYAVITGRADRDITTDLKGALKKYKKGHFAAIDPDDLNKLVEAINHNEARLYKITILAIKLLMLTFVRTSELINATWSEFDLEKSLWTIPAERMKMGKIHHVPLSTQTIAILNQLKELYGDEGYILPSVVTHGKPISNNTILMGLGRLGYKHKMTGHGFRALAMSTIKEKLGYRHEVVDRQLSHQPKSKIDKAYDRANFLSDRIKMMQEWADYIDALPKSSSETKLTVQSHLKSVKAA